MNQCFPGVLFLQPDSLPLISTVGHTDSNLDFSYDVLLETRSLKLLMSTGSPLQTVHWCTLAVLGALISGASNQAWLKQMTESSNTTRFS